MNKKEFLRKINYEDKVILSNIYDKIFLHEKIGRPVYTNEFYPPVIWKSLIKIGVELNCKISTYGVFDESDRRLICIMSKDEIDTIYDYPVELLKIKNKSNFVQLKHGDFLGALMSQGIKREKFGDLILEDQDCYVPVCSDISKFIKENLVRIGKSPCEIETIDVESTKVPEYKFEKRNIVVTSMRIDSVVAGICGVSRNISADMIKKGLILLDYEKIVEKDVNVDVGAIITARGYGKFEIHEITGKTQKGREKLVIKKYV
ncbi:RNA-binding protein [Clostridium sp.]|jgi:RNA-binding protein YlmH|uniref:YlmH family RNA-binding protein n=1 Tax=Clostridium sp. TaxID=1506 RepID=UPI0039F463CD